jgi:hypothetical protein
VLLDTGSYPLSRWRVGGIGLRASEFADALSTECEVRVLVPDEDDDLVPLGDAEPIRRPDWEAALAEADAAVFFDCPDRGRLEQAVESDVLLVSENVAPIEHAEYPSLLAEPDPAAAHQEIVATYARQLAVSHHFLCRSVVERATLVANLCLVGRIGPADVARSRTLDHFVSLVPIGYSARSARSARAAIPNHLADFLWTGGIWSFYDPAVFVRALAHCQAQGVALTGAFLHAVAQPDNAGLIASLEDETARLGIEDAVRFVRAPIAHEERDGFLLGACGLICIGRPGIENETCVRLRIRDNRLFGLPLVVDGHGATALEAGGTAVVLSDPSPESVASALIELSREASREPVGGDKFCYENRLRGFISWLTTTLR